jgi:excisionase family DNA binding protein
MEKNAILIENITGENLREIIREEIKNLEPKKEDAFLTRKELCNKLRVTQPTIDKQVKLGNIVAHRIGTRVVFRESEINLPTIPIRKLHKR